MTATRARWSAVVAATLGGIMFATVQSGAAEARPVLTDPNAPEQAESSVPEAPPVTPPVTSSESAAAIQAPGAAEQAPPAEPAAEPVGPDTLISLPDSARTVPAPQPASTAAASPAVKIARNVVFYAVTGSSEQALQDQLRRLGPHDGSGHWAASTQWSLSWGYPYAVGNAQCGVGAVTINVGLTVTYPRWEAPGGASKRLIEKWDRYLAAVTIHEEGHEKLAVKSGQVLFDALSTLPSTTACAELDRSAQAVGDRIVQRYSELQRQYDRDTGHGANQGASFP